MIASPPGQPDADGLYAIDMATFAVTELVPPVLQGGAWAEGATPVGSLDSGSVFPDPKQYGWGVARVADHLRYWRAMGADGGQTMFVGPLASGPARELALFHDDGSAHELAFVAPADGKYPPQTPIPPVWRHWAGADPSEILVWDDGRQRLLTCPTDFAYGATGSLSPDGSKLALFTAQTPTCPIGSLLADGTVAAGRPDAARLAARRPCTVLAAANVSAAGFSPDGSALFWLVQPTNRRMRIRSCGSPPATAARPGWWVSTASRDRPPSPGSRPAASSISSSTAIWSGSTHTTIRSSRTRSPSR